MEQGFHLSSLGLSRARSLQGGGRALRIPQDMTKRAGPLTRCCPSSVNAPSAPATLEGPPPATAHGELRGTDLESASLCRWQPPSFLDCIFQLFSPLIPVSPYTEHDNGREKKDDSNERWILLISSEKVRCFLPGPNQPVLQAARMDV